MEVGMVHLLQLMMAMALPQLMTVMVLQLQPMMAMVPLLQLMMAMVPQPQLTTATVPQPQLTTATVLQLQRKLVHISASAVGSEL